MEIDAYKSRFQAMLDAEQAEEEAIIQERLASWSIQRLKAEGYCLSEMSAFWLEETRFESSVAAFSLGPGITLPHHRFENGTQVIVSHFDPLKEPTRRGRVLRSTTSQLQISFEEKFDLNEEGGKWRLDVGRSDVVYDRMRAAMSALSHDPLVQEAASVSDDREIILRGSALRDVLLRAFKPGSRYGDDEEHVRLDERSAADDVLFHVDEGRVPPPHAPAGLQNPDDDSYVPHSMLDHPGHFLGSFDGAFAGDMRIMSWARRFSRPDPIRIDGDPQLDGLNETQVRAVATMIAQRASLVQGPPGTGKTKTIIEAVRLIKKEFDVAIPILVCTYTNVAVDNLVEGFVSSGLNPVRVGSEGSIKESLQEHSLMAKLERHPSRGEFEKLAADRDSVEKRLEALESDLNRLRVQPTTARRTLYINNISEAIVKLERHLSVLQAQTNALKAKMTKDVFNEADVICSTSLTAVHPSFRHIDFPVVFLDEASMSTEPATLIPLMKGCRHVSLIGDHKQLPPVILSSEAKSLGLAISLFERLTEEGVVPSIMLNVQYRMHPSISRFPSEEFYNRALLDGMVDKAGNVPDRLLPPTSQHLTPTDEKGKRPSVVFMDHRGPESTSGRSRVNWTDAMIVCSVVNDLLLSNPDLQGSDIGVIAPYAAQVRLIHRLFNSDVRTLERFKASLGDHRFMQLGDIEVKTVDGYEGREKEVIVFSTVRNNSGGQIGFLSDRRRLNVGLTRAKRALFVVGSLQTLGAGRVDERRVRKEMERQATAQEEEPAPTLKPTQTRTRSDVWGRYVRFLREEDLIRPLEGAPLRTIMAEHIPIPPAAPAVEAYASLHHL